MITQAQQNLIIKGKEYEHVLFQPRKEGKKYFCKSGKRGCSFQNHKTGECQFGYRCENQREIA